jgi:hypothetical protein
VKPPRRQENVGRAEKRGKDVIGGTRRTKIKKKPIYGQRKRAKRWSGADNGNYLSTGHTDIPTGVANLCPIRARVRLKTCPFWLFCDRGLVRSQRTRVVRYVDSYYSDDNRQCLPTSRSVYAHSVIRHRRLWLSFGIDFSSDTQPRLRTAQLTSTRSRSLSLVIALLTVTVSFNKVSHGVELLPRFFVVQRGFPFASSRQVSAS